MNYKVHLDGYDQTALITGKGPSARSEIFYFAENTLGAVRVNDYKYRFIDQPGGWLGNTVKLDWPILINLRLDPLERTSLPRNPWIQANWFGFEFWRFVLAQQDVGLYAQSFIDFPPCRRAPALTWSK